MLPNAQKFWANVETSTPNECWEWRLYRNELGYGIWRVGPKTYKAHRIAFGLSNGFVPELVMHWCDNPSCCNPNHLAAGNCDLNNKDRAAKGRSAMGVLTDAELKYIRESNLLLVEIASRFSITAQYAGQIRKGIRAIRA